MAKESHVALYKVNDMIILHKQIYKVLLVYPQEKRYRVEATVGNAEWKILYPDHSEITGLVEDINND